MSITKTPLPGNNPGGFTEVEKTDARYRYTREMTLWADSVYHLGNLSDRIVGIAKNATHGLGPNDLPDFDPQCRIRVTVEVLAPKDDAPEEAPKDDVPKGKAPKGKGAKVTTQPLKVEVPKEDAHKEVILEDETPEDGDPGDENVEA